MTCPILACIADVSGPLRVCSYHFKLIPKPLRQALSSYAGSHKGGPAHKASFARATESIEQTLAFHAALLRQKPARPAYWDD